MKRMPTKVSKSSSQAGSKKTVAVHISNGVKSVSSKATIKTR